MADEDVAEDDGIDDEVAMVGAVAAADVEPGTAQLFLLCLYSIAVGGVP